MTTMGKLMRFQLKNSVKKFTTESYRFVFNAFEKISGTEKTFFIEFTALNPNISQNEILLGFKSRVNISSDDLQNVLAGTIAAQNLRTEKIITPSYCMIRAGLLGSGAKQICKYFTIKQLSISQRSFNILADNCSFSENKLFGALEVSPIELNDKPELLCNSGIISWDLQYENKLSFGYGYETKTQNWTIPGAKTFFSGNINIDEKEFTVIPKKSFGYIEHFWGKTFPEPYIHLSSSNLISIITGKLLSESSFCLKGNYNDTISLFVNFEGQKIELPANIKKRSNQIIWECTQTPENESEVRLHWTVSANTKNFVIDIDVFCPASQMYLRTLEMPEGNRKTMKILCGATGNGEIRLYKKIQKNLELLEHARISTSLCEFGQPEEFETT